ncbi:glycosyltransferase family 4 protein [Thermoactinomyces sp. DSM 45892]|uniref:glycosyltransferase family 4 protein n=1 Tax=Thermoactinomyces sp. DSM 45892 TaxID=1882753 RepID=UPI00089B03C0|nr:glycosyltransferase family 4 protein [Thermoactinomyces sp. DSM 45892]SDZ21238.1 Glycosyltransferase involved in cell wall bisynthesis [Thermoactinomyces sp. DSM 45892]
MKKVLVVSHMYPSKVNPHSGIFVHNQTKALRDAGCEVQVVVPIPSFPLYKKWKGYSDLPSRTDLEGIPVHYVPTRMFPGGFFFHRYGAFYIRSLKPILHQIKQDFPYELLHCHTIFPDGYVGGKLKEELGVPVISTIHGSDIMLYPKKNKKIYERTIEALKANDHLITVSDRLRDEVDQMVPGLPVSTIYNGFDPNRFYPIDRQEARLRLGIPPEGKKIVFIGNLLPVKGISYLLQAFHRLVQGDQHEGLDLYVVGAGPLQSSIEEEIAELSLVGRVHLMGRRPYDEIPLWMNSADVTALTSLSEGLPSILLESMGCGRPMVATDVGGIKEVLQDGVTGRLARPKDVEHIAQCLHEMVTKDDVREELGKQAYVASRGFSLEQNANQVIERYEKIKSLTY